jgi:hypothetical protein
MEDREADWGDVKAHALDKFGVIGLVLLFGTMLLFAIGFGTLIFTPNITEDMDFIFEYYGKASFFLMALSFYVRTYK